ncbi:MAG: permease-like cell division protein FtsX [Candidatus Saccharibacteria bacterium]|nr:permease-like cell division protein FtsX [Candidatus Saccharibacteria bacterium]
MAKSNEIKNTKKNLRTMSRNGNSHRLRSSRRILKYGTISFGRNIWLSIAAILVMTVTLVVLFITVVAMSALNTTAESMREKIDITVYFKPKTPEATLEEMAEIMRQDENVRSVEISTSEQEMEKVFSENSSDEAIAATLDDDNMRQFILSSIQSLMRIKVYNTEDVTSVKAIINNNETFQKNLDTEKETSYDANRAEVDTINSWAKIARYGGIAASGVFLIISILVIFNTIRMAIFSRREEIYMMKLVGADNNFVRGPFLIEAQLCGLISGTIAAGIGYFVTYKAAPSLSAYGIDLSQVQSILNSPKLVIVFLAFIGLGLLIGTISAALAIKKYLKKQ